jgi:hypothetical protein
VPALTRMLAAVVQLGPCSNARQSALMLLTTIVRQDMSVWQQPAGAAVVGEMVMQLGPAVLHAHQQQQQSQADAKDCQFALWYWAVTLMNTVRAGGCCTGVCYLQRHYLSYAASGAVQLQSVQPCSADTTVSYATVCRCLCYQLHLAEFYKHESCASVLHSALPCSARQSSCGCSNSCRFANNQLPGSNKHRVC